MKCLQVNQALLKLLNLQSQYFPTQPHHSQALTGAAALSRCISGLSLIIWFWCSVSVREKWNYRINVNLIFHFITLVYLSNKCIQERKYKIEQRPLQFIYWITAVPAESIRCVLITQVQAFLLILPSPCFSFNYPTH